MRHHDAAAGHERRNRRNALAVDVIERQRRQHAVVLGQLVRARYCAAGVNHVRVRQQHAFRHPRRARREHQHRRRLRFDRREVSRFAATIAQAIDRDRLYACACARAVN